MKKCDWTDAEIQENIEKLERNINSCKKKIEWYKAEQERRKKEVPLGVPCDGKFYVDLRGRVQEVWEEKVEEVNFNAFNSRESAEKHSEMLLAWRKALVANAKGEPIDIEVLLPLMKKGYVAMDEDGIWFWYECKPFKEIRFWDAKKGNFGEFEKVSFPFNIKTAEDWRESLLECGL